MSSDEMEEEESVLVEDKTPDTGFPLDNHSAETKKENHKEEVGKRGEEHRKETPPTETPQQDIFQRIPRGEFLHPKEGQIVKGKIKIQFKIEKIQTIEFYIRRPESLVETYLGRGELRGNEIWEFEWDSTQTPNGAYFLISKITSEYGSYEGVTILIEVQNEPKRERREIQELAQNVQQHQETIREEESRVEEEMEEMAEEIQEQVEEMTQELAEIVEEAVEEDKKEEVKAEVEEKKEEVKERVEEKLQKAIETKDDKERHKVKEEIKKTLEEIAKPAIEKVKPEKKHEVVNLSSELKQTVEQTLKKVDELAKKKQLVEIKKEELFNKDSDKDNVPDFEELRLGTDPFNPDTDNDGFLDGSEIKLGFDPLKPSPADKIKYQEPEKVKVKISEHLKVEKVEITTQEEKKVLVIRGKALPNTFVTVYIYSLPIIVITKADSNGNWEYVLDKPLVDGQHKIYVAVTNNKGEIEEASEPFVFAKTGDKIIRLIEPAKDKVLSPAQILQRSFAVLIAGIVLFALGLALTIIGLLLRSKKFPK